MCVSVYKGEWSVVGHRVILNSRGGRARARGSIKIKNLFVTFLRLRRRACYPHIHTHTQAVYARIITRVFYRKSEATN